MKKVYSLLLLACSTLLFLPTHGQDQTGTTHDLNFVRPENFGTTDGLLTATDLLVSVRKYVNEAPEFIKEIDSVHVTNLNAYFSTNSSLFAGKMISDVAKINATVYEFEFTKGEKITVQVVDSLRNVVKDASSARNYETKAQGDTVIDNIMNHFGKQVMSPMYGLVFDPGTNPKKPKGHLFIVVYNTITPLPAFAEYKDYDFAFAPVVISSGSEFGVSVNPTSPQVLYYPLQSEVNRECMIDFVDEHSRRSAYANCAMDDHVMDMLFARTWLPTVTLDLRDIGVNDGDQYDITINGTLIKTGVLSGANEVALKLDLLPKTKNYIIVRAVSEGALSPCTLRAEIPEVKLRYDIRLKKTQKVGFVIQRM